MPLSEKDSFAILRPVESAQWTDIDAAVVNALQIKAHPPIPVTPGVMVVRTHELYERMTRSRALTNDSVTNHAKILKPAITSSLDGLTVDVKDVQSFGNHKNWRNIGLVVGDPEGVMTDERNTYLKRAWSERSADDQFAFTVTLARVKPELATSALLLEILEQMPARLSLEPIVTTYPADMERAMSDEFGVKDQAPAIPSSVPEVRRISLMPNDALNALRAASARKTD